MTQNRMRHIAAFQPGDFVVRASVAQRIGENPGRDANDNDADNTRDRVRFWLQAVKQF